MVNNQPAQATFDKAEVLSPDLQAKLVPNLFEKYLEYMTSSSFSTCRGSVEGSLLPHHYCVRVLCKCGSITEVERSVLTTKRGVGKTVECRRCRNLRIARETAELDQDFYGYGDEMD